MLKKPTTRQEAVVFKLYQTNCPLYLVKIIHSFLSDRKFQVVVNGSRSTTHSIPFGVPQGSVLSPALYNIFTSDTLMVDGVVYAFFADDTAFLAADKDPTQIVAKLQHAQNILEEYQRKWRMKINATKTQKKSLHQEKGSSKPSKNRNNHEWTGFSLGR